MSVDHVLLVHGYSETSLDAYSNFPAILNSAGYTVDSIGLSAFDSLDDTVTIDDLADGLEQHVTRLEANGWAFGNTAVICHSTGALVARRWILNRRLASKSAVIPSHLITLAGANHGSTLAQVGKSVLGYVQKLLQKHILSVGAAVLTDLDYGSDFLLRLNKEWLIARNDGTLDGIFIFSMGGDSLGSDLMKLLWQTSEPGCDNTVRISGANLNYRYLVADPRTGAVTPIALQTPVPHLIVPGYSHFGPDSGILASAHTATDPPAQAVFQALKVSDAPSYTDVLNDWSSKVSTWLNDPNKADDANATLVFSLRDRSGQSVEDCFIGFLDSTAADDVTAYTNASPAVNKHSPVHNDVQRGSYSFYLNWPKYHDIEHRVHIEAHSSSPYIKYNTVDYTPSAETSKMIQPNEFTYVDVTMERDAFATFAVYGWTPGADLSKIAWNPMPFPPEGQIPPTSP